MMKLPAVVVLVALTIGVRAQNYPFVKDFVRGAIVLKDSTKKGRSN